MSRNLKHIDIEIDKLTNSVENSISGDRFETEVIKVSKDDLRSVKKGNGWKFDWKYEIEQSGRYVYKLTIKGNPKVMKEFLLLFQKQG